MNRTEPIDARVAKAFPYLAMKKRGGADTFGTITVLDKRGYSL